MIKKNKPTRLKGKKLIDLFEEVYERDGNECQYGFCALAFQNHRPPLDIPHHVLRKSLGGGDTKDNLISLCVFCHRHIHDHPEIEISNENGEWIFTKRESKVI